MKTISHILCVLCFPFWHILTCCDTTFSYIFSVSSGFQAGNSWLRRKGWCVGLRISWCWFRSAWSLVHPAMAGRDPGRGYQSVAGCRRVHILIHFVWKKEMERRWCNHFFNLVILCYTQYILYLYIYMNIVIWFNSQYCWVAKHLQTSMITESVSVQHPELDEAGPLDLHSTVFDFFFYVLSPQKMKSGPWSMTGTTTGWIWFESWPLSVCGDESRLISSRWLRFGSVWLHPSFFSETLWSGKIKNTFDDVSSLQIMEHT